MCAQAVRLGKFRTVPTELEDVWIIEPQVWRDERGFFLESYSAEDMGGIGIDFTFPQDNHSRSTRGVLRGLHYQLPPRAQGKLVRAVSGEVFDVAVDVRRSSPAFGRWVGVYLSAANLRMLWIPPGFAHGFLVVSEFADVLYKTTEIYSPEHERTIRWDDGTIGIKWPLLAKPLVSRKDELGSSFSEAEVFD